MNNRFETYLTSRLTLTLGDEFQALFTLDAPIFQIIDSPTSRVEACSATLWDWFRGK